MAVLEFAIFLFLSSSTFLFRFKQRIHTTRTIVGDTTKPDDYRNQNRDIFDNESFLKILTSQKDRRFSYKNHIIKANTSQISSKHPVIEAILRRWATNSLPGKRSSTDSRKIALCIEGGGMRGCVAAGSSAAINFLGLNDAIDIVYGSSAGSMVAAYFISRQFDGVKIYHDILPAAGSSFVDKRQLLRAMGFRPKAAISNVMEQLFSNMKPKRFLAKRFAFISGKVANYNMNDSFLVTVTKNETINSTHDASEVFKLSFLLDQVMGEYHPLDWETFSKNEITQELRIVATLLNNMSTILFSRRQGHYHDLPSLLRCMRASMLVPGITGDLMAIPNSRSPRIPFFVSDKAFKVINHIDRMINNSNTDTGYNVTDADSATMNPRWMPTWLLKLYRGVRVLPNDSIHPIPVVDAFLCEPMPYRSAVEEGATHVVVLRTRPDPCPVLGKGPGLYESIIAPLFFNRYGLHEPIEWLLNQEHHLVYAKDVLLLNEAAKGHVDGVSINGSDKQVHILPIACGTNSREVGQLETNRQLLLQGMRDGARRVFELFLPAMLELRTTETDARVDTIDAFSAEGLELESMNIDSLIDNLVNMIFPLSILDTPTKLEQYTSSVTLLRGISNSNSTPP